MRHMILEEPVMCGIIPNYITFEYQCVWWIDLQHHWFGYMCLDDVKTAMSMLQSSRGGAHSLFHSYRKTVCWVRYHTDEGNYQS